MHTWHFSFIALSPGFPTWHPAGQRLGRQKEQCARGRIHSRGKEIGAFPRKVNTPSFGFHQNGGWRCLISYFKRAAKSPATGLCKIAAWTIKNPGNSQLLSLIKTPSGLCPSSLKNCSLGDTSVPWVTTEGSLSDATRGWLQSEGRPSLLSGMETRTHPQGWGNGTWLSAEKSPLLCWNLEKMPAELLWRHISMFLSIWAGCGPCLDSGQKCHEWVHFTSPALLTEVTVFHSPGENLQRIPLASQSLEESRSFSFNLFLWEVSTAVNNTLQCWFIKVFILGVLFFFLLNTRHFVRGKK